MPKGPVQMAMQPQCDPQFAGNIGQGMDVTQPMRGMFEQPVGPAHRIVGDKKARARLQALQESP